MPSRSVQNDTQFNYTSNTVKVKTFVCNSIAALPGKEKRKKY